MVLKYQKPDEHIWINTGDRHLAPIQIDILNVIQRTYKEFSLTPPKKFPDVEVIAGFDLKPKDQIFERVIYPVRLKELETEIRLRYRNDKTGVDRKEQYIINDFWDELNARHDEYTEEIEWIRRAWYHRLFGYWFFCNGKPTYITGVHWTYLNFWYLDDILPDYRDTDRRWYIAQKWFQLDTTTFREMDQKTGRPVKNKDGRYEMVETGRRTFIGTNNPKSRRVGHTSKAQCDNTEYATRTIESHIGIQGKDNDNAQNVFKNHFVRPFKKLPLIFKPLASQVTPNEIMSFESDGITEGLNTRYDHATTQYRGAYDGYKLKRIHIDEPGKCLKINELVLGGDGLPKLVQEINVGDFVLGIDGLPKKVTDIHRGKEMMYDIIPNKGRKWGCGLSHLMVLKVNTKIYSGKYKSNKGDILVMPLREYIKSVPDSIKKSMSLFRMGETPTQCRFKVVQTGIDDYYGFTLEGDGLFFLDDFTVMHNCLVESVNKRHAVIKNCLSLGSGAEIIGFMQYTTTVDEMDRSAGENYLLLSQASHWERRGENGQTASGLVNIFLPAYDGLQGFIDRYGQSVIDTPTPEQARFIGRNIGARQYLENIRAQLLREKRIEELIEHKRQFPMEWSEVFTPPAKNTFFRVDILENRISELQLDVEPPRRGNLYHRSADRDSDIMWQEDEENGRFYLSRKFLPGEINQRTRDQGTYRPINPDKFVACADTYRVEKTEGSRMSNGAGVVRWKHDVMIDPPDKDIHDWDTSRAIMTYCNRPSTLDEYGEDMLMMCVFCGSLMYPEANIDFIEKYFIRRGYAGYLMYDTDWKTGRPRAYAGFYSTIDTKKKIFTLTANEIAVHGHRIRHVDYLKECMAIKSVDEMTEYDLFTAYGGTLLAEENTLSKIIEPAVDTSDFLAQHAY